MNTTMTHVYLVALMIGCFSLGMGIAHYAGVVPLINKIHQLQEVIKIYQQEGF